MRGQSMRLSSEAMQSIRELHETYSDAVVRQDLEAYLACWAEDGRRTGAGAVSRPGVDDPAAKVLNEAASVSE